MKKLKVFLILSFYLVSGLFSSVYAQVGDPNAVPAPGPRQLQDLVQRVIMVSVGIGFLFSFAFLAWSGIKFITSGGESKALSDAWRTFTWALLGLAFLALAGVALRIIEGFTGVKVTEYCFGFPGAYSLCDKR